MDTKEGMVVGMNWEIGIGIYTLLGHVHNIMYKIDNWWEPTIEHRKLYSMLCGDLIGKESQKRGNICKHMADSLCYAAQNNTIL